MSVSSVLRNDKQGLIEVTPSSDLPSHLPVALSPYPAQPQKQVLASLHPGIHVSSMHPCISPRTRAGMVSCMAFSPNGDLLAAGSYSGAIALYDARTWEQVFLLQGHKGGLTQVRLPPCGRQGFLPVAGRATRGASHR